LGLIRARISKMSTLIASGRLGHAWITATKPHQRGSIRL
jgi:hypothetical protein